MLDNLRAMGVFSCVVEEKSFNGAAKKLGITTSAVSQQIRSLENELKITLLHRSTRKVSMTEAGLLFFQSCQEMLAAAERGKIRINEIQNNIIGPIRIATPPIIGVMHIVPAISRWIQAHDALDLYIKADYDNNLQQLNSELDIVIQLEAENVDPNKFDIYPLITTQQIIVVSPSYLNKYAISVEHPLDLEAFNFISVKAFEEIQKDIDFYSLESKEKVTPKLVSRIKTNNVFIMKSLCMEGHGFSRILYINAQQEIKSGQLIHVLKDWKLPEFTFYAITRKDELQSTKVKRCIELLKNYFSHHPQGFIHN